MRNFAFFKKISRKSLSIILLKSHNLMKFHETWQQCRNTKRQFLRIQWCTISDEIYSSIVRTWKATLLALFLIILRIFHLIAKTFCQLGTLETYTTRHGDCILQILANFESLETSKLLRFLKHPNLTVRKMRFLFIFGVMLFCHMFCLLQNQYRAIKMQLNDHIHFFVTEIFNFEIFVIHDFFIGCIHNLSSKPSNPQIPSPQVQGHICQAHTTNIKLTKFKVTYVNHTNHTLQNITPTNPKPSYGKSTN